jgi:COP9 signalosome complex subunit 3
LSTFNLCIITLTTSGTQIEKDEITATLSADGTVTFSDPPVSISRTEVDGLLREAQAQGAFLAALEREMAGSREFLTKAMKSKEDGERWAMGGAGEEEMMQFVAGGAGAGWTEETLFS